MVKSYNKYWESKETNIDSSEIDDVIDNNDEDVIDNDHITLSKKFISRLNEITSNNGDIKVGDKVTFKNKTKNKLSDKVFEYINKKEIFEVLRVNKNGKIDIGYHTRYIRESDNKKILKVFYFNKNRFNNFSNLNKVVQLFLLIKDIDPVNLVNNPVDFLDVNQKGEISFIPRRLSSGGDPFKNTNRQGTKKINRLIKRIVTNKYYDENITPKDIELFMNKWNILFDDSYKLTILEGDDILDAYNTDKIGGGWDGSSCANSRGNNMNINKFKVYTENSQIKCVVVYHKGKIYGRRMLFEGIQTETLGDFIEGTKYLLLNGFYGQGGTGSKIDQVIKRWGDDNNAHFIENLYYKPLDIFRIKIDNVKYPNYPPWDSMLVNFTTGEISSKKKNKENGWTSAYGARYVKPKKIINPIKKFIKKFN